MAAPFVHSVFVGGPRTITDAAGTWVSSIGRQPVVGAAQVGLRGLAGDSVAQPYHGSPDAAICAHLMEHYRSWNASYGMRLKAGAVGENVTVDDLLEEDVLAGDVVRVGTAVLQVSGPRIPCANLARRIGRADWVRLTIEENRTGFYLRVLTPGAFEPGDAWLIQERGAPEATIPAINRCMFLRFDPAYAARMLDMPGLGAWWKERAREKLT